MVFTLLITNFQEILHCIEPFSLLYRFTFRLRLWFKISETVKKKNWHYKPKILEKLLINFSLISKDFNYRLFWEKKEIGQKETVPLNGTDRVRTGSAKKTNYREAFIWEIRFVDKLKVDKIWYCSAFFWDLFTISNYCPYKLHRLECQQQHSFLKVLVELLRNQFH